MRTIEDVQLWCGERAQPIPVDGVVGPVTLAALSAIFVNLNAQPTSPAQIQSAAARLGCTPIQIAAFADVESKGSGYRPDGRPDLLLERHYFHRLTGGRFGLSDISRPRWAPGTYGSKAAQWDRLMRAARLDPMAAFASCSWGQFQVMGAHFDLLKYRSPLDMAYACVVGQAAHLDMFCRYIEANNLQGAVRRISNRPEDCVPAAIGYNGRSAKVHNYHGRIAAAHRRLGG